MISGLQSPSLANVSFSLSGNIGIVNFNNVLPSLATDELVLQLPSELSISNSLYALSTIDSSAFPANSPIFIKNYTLNKIMLNPFSSNSLSNFVIQFISFSIVTPAIQTGNISI
jgi:hypothetical protein